MHYSSCARSPAIRLDRLGHGIVMLASRVYSGKGGIHLTPPAVFISYAGHRYPGMFLALYHKQAEQARGLHVIHNPKCHHRVTRKAHVKEDKK